MFTFRIWTYMDGNIRLLVRDYVMCVRCLMGATRAEFLRDRSPSLQPAPRLQLERARRHARAKGARWKTAVLLSPRRRVVRGVRNHAQCCACSRARGARRVWGSHDLVCVGERRGVLFCADLFFEKMSCAHSAAGGHTQKTAPRN